MLTDLSKPSARRHSPAVPSKGSSAAAAAIGRPSRRWTAAIWALAVLAVVACWLLVLLAQPAPAAEPKNADAAPQGECDEKEAEIGTKWHSLFDGKTLKGWKVPVFGGDGDVEVEKGQITLGMGGPMTGITVARKMPRWNYELKLEARRVDGIDFFATTTFPVGDDRCSFVTGGWAGTVVGLSCIDYYDASDNITTDFYNFKDKQWYTIRIRVTKAKIECWIDDDKIVDLPIEGKKISIRDEVDLCNPMGITSYQTVGAVRNIKIRRLTEKEVAKIAESVEQQ
jgi:hypothetical protein